MLDEDATTIRRHLGELAIPHARCAAERAEPHHRSTHCASLLARFSAIRSGCTARRRTLVCSQSTADPVERSSDLQRRPLGVPRPGGAFQLVAAGGVQQRGHRAGCLHRRGAGADGGDRVVLVRHRRRPAGALGDLGQLADVTLGEQHDVQTDLGDRCGGQPPSPGDRCRRAPLRVAGCRSRGQIQARGEALDDDRMPLAERRPVAGRAAEPDRRRHITERGGSLGETVMPSAGHSGERRGQGVLAERPGDHRHVAVTCLQAVDHGAGVAQAGAHDLGAPPHHHERRCVDDVLARRAAMDVLGGRLAHVLAEGRHEGDHRVAAVGCLVEDGRHVELLHQAGAGDRLRGGLGDVAGVRLRAGERGLDVEQCLQPRRGGRRLGNRPPAHEERERVVGRTHRRPP